MKTLLVMRHAKSSWSDGSLDDFDRPLNKRGRRDAPRMGQLLKHQEIVPDLIVSSAALRASETAAAVGSACGFEGSIQLTHKLYLAPPAAYLAVAAQQDDSRGRLLLVGHNPGVETLIRQFSGQPRPVPTAAVAHFELECDHWREAANGVLAHLCAYWRPRDLDELDLGP